MLISMTFGNRNEAVTNEEAVIKLSSVSILVVVSIIADENMKGNKL
jgi:hypothetical protein